MSEMTDAEYEALAARLTDPGVELPKLENVLTGAAAVAAGREFMLREYGSQEALDAALRSAGRPRLGTKPKGASPSVRGRIAEADRAAFDELIRQTGRNESELVREAVHLLLEQHKLAS
ncbi:MAG: ribbon-helix-helix protein, CopG family [Leifsonia sp.]